MDRLAFALASAIPPVLEKRYGIYLAATTISQKSGQLEGTLAKLMWPVKTYFSGK